MKGKDFLEWLHEEGSQDQVLGIGYHWTLIIAQTGWCVKNSSALAKTWFDDGTGFCVCQCMPQLQAVEQYSDCYYIIHPELEIIWRISHVGWSSRLYA